VEALSSRGYRTYEARSGTEALDVLKRKVIDLMVTDAIMPGMSGAELMVTSGYTVTEMSFADTPKNVPLLRKPYNLTELYHMVADVLRQ